MGEGNNTEYKFIHFKTRQRLCSIRNITKKLTV